MVQRLVSSMRPTTYVSAASCRHMMALPWKHKSYLPTSRAILQINCRKGSFWMRSSVLFWNHQISQRATVPRLVLPCLLYLTSLEEFLLGGFASLGQLELPPGWLLLTWCRWPSLHSHLGPTVGLAMMIVTFPHPLGSLLPPPTSQPHPHASSSPLSWVRALWLGMGGEPERGPPSLLC